jgi:hypothetical protein
MRYGMTWIAHNGRHCALQGDDYESLVIVAEALVKAGHHEVTIWQGMTVLRRD